MAGRQLLPEDSKTPPLWGHHARDAVLDIIVFSKDRACQLDALLRSMREFFHLPHRLHVLYTSSNEAFESAYDPLRYWHQGVNWVDDRGIFRLSMCQLMEDINRGPGRYLMFLVDDMMFTREFTAASLMTQLDDDEDVLAVSLRMGENITYCYTRNIETTPPAFSAGYRWCWKTASPGYWNYPMSQDGHIFRTADFANLLPQLRFRSPNTLEANQSAQPFPRPHMICEQTPCVINVAANRVQSIFKNRCGNISAEFLNESFLNGLAIDATAFEARVYNACHVDEDLPLIEDRRIRQRPPPTVHEINGRSNRVIDLRGIPVFILSCRDDEERRAAILQHMDDLGINAELVEGLRVDPGWVGVALGHLKILKLQRARPPFLVLEDDLCFKDNFNPVLTIPQEAHAYYLGVSRFGMSTPGEISWGKADTLQWQHYGEAHLRVYNMLARHAVLYLDKGFQNAVIDSQIEALSNRRLAHPGDMGQAQLQASHVVLTPRYNVSRQLSQDSTDIDIPEAIPQGEVGDNPLSTSSPTRSSHTTSCVISHKYRFIYFVIAKNATSTLRHELGKARYHSQEVSLSTIDEGNLRDYFKFAFFRDPLSRTVSAYQEISLRKDSGELENLDRPFMTMPDNEARFAAFVTQIGTGHWDSHVRPQPQFIHGLELDFYGRVEQLQLDFDDILARLAITPSPLLTTLRSRKSRKDGLGYTAYNVDENTLPAELTQKVREIYHSDVALLERHCPLLDSHNIATPQPGGGMQLDLELRGGHNFHFQYVDGTDFAREAKRMEQNQCSTPEQIKHHIVQLPSEGGREALTFNSADISAMRITHRGPHPGMNVSEGHLGGYISARGTAKKRFNLQNGDPATWSPSLWRWAREELGIDSVLDVGCGEGHSSLFFHELGCRVQGVDGSERAHRDSVIPEYHLRHDFTQGPFLPDKCFDLVWSCEFVEHVEECYTQNFLASFSLATRYILMTAARPGNPGWHHVNCQPEAYWQNKLNRLGFDFDQTLTDRARAIAEPGHFRNIGMVFVRREAASELPCPPIDSDVRCDQLPVRDMEVAQLNEHRFYLFLDIFVHPSRDRVTAVLPYYHEDWSPAEHGIDYQQVEMQVAGEVIRGTYIPHRLDSYEPCALLDFTSEALKAVLCERETIDVTVMVGPHCRQYQLSTRPPPSYRVLMSLVVKNENRWIRHFLEYYLRCLEVDHVLVYDNGTGDREALLNILQPYFKAGTVTYIPWDYRWRNLGEPHKMTAQPQQEAHSLNRFANSEWIGFLDVDEFLRIPDKTLPAWLDSFDSAKVDGFSFGLRWFHYHGTTGFDDIVDPPLTFLEAGRDSLGRKRQKLLVSPRRMRFLRLHTLQEGGRELQVDDTDIFFHHYCQRPYRFSKGMSETTQRDDYMLRFCRQLALDDKGQASEMLQRLAQQQLAAVADITLADVSSEGWLSQLQPVEITAGNLQPWNIMFKNGGNPRAQAYAQAWEKLLEHALCRDPDRHQINCHYHISLSDRNGGHGAPLRDGARWLFVSSRGGGTKCALFPNFEHAWHLDTGFYQKLQQRAKQKAYAQRLPNVVWRGTPTHNIRCTLVQMSSEVEHLDACFSEINFEPQRERLCKAGMDPDSIRLHPIPAESYYCDYRAVVVVDGIGAAFRLACHFATGQCVLLAHEYEEWFYPLLEPWVHYVPVAPDLADLPESVAWVQNNVEEAEAIGRRGELFFKQYLGVEGTADFVMGLHRGMSNELR